MGSIGNSYSPTRYDDTYLATKANSIDVYPKSIEGLFTGFRNKLINGDFDVWQRNIGSPTFVAPVSNFFSADRWTTSADGSGGAGSVSLQVFTPGQTDVPGEPKFFYRRQITSAASGQTGGGCYVTQRIESARTLAGKRATLTAYLKGSGTLPSISVIQAFGGGGSSPVETIIATNLVLTGSWQKVSIAFDIPSVSGKSFGDDGWMGPVFYLPINRTFTLDIARVSLVEGDSTAEDDPFSPRHIQQELALCQRYYETYQSDVISTGYANTGSYIYKSTPFKVTKRVTPTIATSNISYSSMSTLSLNASSNMGICFSAICSSTGGGTVYTQYNWTADAEI